MVSTLRSSERLASASHLPGVQRLYFSLYSPVSKFLVLWCKCNGGQRANSKDPTLISAWILSDSTTFRPILWFCLPPAPKLNLDSTARTEVGRLRSWDSVYRSLLTFHYRTVDKNVFPTVFCLFCSCPGPGLVRSCTPWGEQAALWVCIFSWASSFLGCPRWGFGLLQCPQGCLSPTCLEKRSLQLARHGKNTILALALLRVTLNSPLCCGFR